MRSWLVTVLTFAAVGCKGEPFPPATLSPPVIVEDPSRAAMKATEKNLKQIARAMHQFHDTHNYLPGARFGVGLSWRVALLPFLEQDALYREFKTNEPWDSSHNRALITKMPTVFASADGKGEPGTTRYRLFTGLHTPFGSRTSERGRNLATITDGTSNTLGIVEAKEAVPWTQPNEFSYTATSKLPPLGGTSDIGFFATFIDGRVAIVRQDVAEVQIRAMITHDGGEIIARDEPPAPTEKQP